MHVETCTEKPARRQEHVRPAAAVPPRRRRGLQVEGPPISYERDEALVWVSTPTVDSNLDPDSALASIRSTLLSTGTQRKS